MNIIERIGRVVEAAEDAGEPMLALEVLRPDGTVPKLRVWRDQYPIAATSSIHDDDLPFAYATCAGSLTQWLMARRCMVWGSGGIYHTSSAISPEGGWSEYETLLEALVHAAELLLGIAKPEWRPA